MPELWVETTGQVLVLRDGELGEVLVNIEIIDGGFVCKVEPARLGPDAMQATTQVLLRHADRFIACSTAGPRRPIQETRGVEGRRANHGLGVRDPKARLLNPGP